MAFADEHDVCAGAPDSGFTDKGTTHADNIDCLYAYGITTGQTATTFGTFADMTRGQASTFFVNFASVATDGAILDAIDEDVDVPFTDIDGTTHESNIEAAYRLELISGTTATTYSPNESMTREQFATVLYNAHESLGVEFDEDYADAFTDTANSVHEDNINALAGEGIISGTTATTYSPQLNVTRGQLATLFMRSAQFLDDLGLWTDERPWVEEPVTNQSYVVTPTDAAFNTVSTLTGDNVDRGVRSYSADVGDASEVDIALIPAGNVHFDNGFVSFTDADPLQASNRADDLGETRAVIETVQGIDQDPDPDERAYVEGIAPSQGTVTFTINSMDPDTAVIPVVFADADNNQQLNLDAEDEPTEDFGVGGAKHWSAAEAPAGTSEGEVQIFRPDRNEFTTADDSLEDPSRVNGDGNLLFNYDPDEDTFLYESPGVTAFELTAAQWEAYLSGTLTELGTNVFNARTTGNVLGDAVSVDYNPDGSSTFTIVHDVPEAVGAVDTTIDPQNGIVVSWDAVDNPDVAGYEVWRSFQPAGADPGPYEHIAGEGSPVVGTELTDTDDGQLRVGTYRYLVLPFNTNTEDNDFGDPYRFYGPESEVGEQFVDPAVVEATPYSTLLDVDESLDADDLPGIVTTQQYPSGVLDEGDTLTVTFENAPIEVGDDPVIELMDADGTQARITSDEADFRVGGTADQQLIVDLTDDPVHFVTGTGGSTTIATFSPTAVSASQDIGNEFGDWNLPRSGLWSTELNSRVLETFSNWSLPEQVPSSGDPADITSRPDANTVNIPAGMTGASNIVTGDGFAIFDAQGGEVATGTYNNDTGNTVSIDGGFDAGDRLFFVYVSDSGLFGGQMVSQTTDIWNPTDIPTVSQVFTDVDRAADTIVVEWQARDLVPGSSITQVGPAGNYTIYDADNNDLVATGASAEVTDWNQVTVELDADLSEADYTLRVAEGTVQEPNNIENVPQTVPFFADGSAGADVTALRIDGEASENTTASGNPETNDTTPTVTGQAEVVSTIGADGSVEAVEIRVDAEYTGTIDQTHAADVSADGSFEFTFEDPLPEGEHRMEVEASDEFGESGVQWETLFTINLGTPTVDVSFDDPGINAENVDAVSVSGSTTNYASETVELEFEDETGDTVTDSTDTDDDGNFSTTTNLSALADNEDVTVTATVETSPFAPDSDEDTVHKIADPLTLEDVTISQAGAQATLTTGDGAPDAIEWNVVELGTDGNALVLRLLDPEQAAEPLSVTYEPDLDRISVTLSTDGQGDIDSTTQEVVDAVEAEVDFVEGDPADGSEIVSDDTGQFSGGEAAELELEWSQDVFEGDDVNVSVDQGDGPVDHTEVDITDAVAAIIWDNVEMDPLDGLDELTVGADSFRDLAYNFNTARQGAIDSI